MAAAPILDRTFAQVPFARVLFPTDFCRCSESAMTYALRIAADYHSRLSFLHVLPQGSNVALEPTADRVPHAPELDRHEAEKHIRVLENSGVLSNSEPTILLESGVLPGMIEAVIQRRDIDLVVAGTHGRGGINKLIFGSIAEAISRRAPCAVMIVGPRVPTVPPQPLFREVLYATGFGTGSLIALHYAKSIAQKYRAKLTLLHACSLLEGAPFVDSNTVLPQERERLNALLAEDLQYATAPAAIARIGLATGTILRAAKDSNADLIVMGVHSTRAITAVTHIPWTTAHQVIIHAECPVLTIRG
jgi:nucleotide-binding universal stress UspA family protein